MSDGEDQPAKRDVRFGRRLAASGPIGNKAVRDKTVKVLSKWFSKQQHIGEADLIKIWKGLFYCMWHSDKPIVQMELAERLASMIHVFPGDRGLLYYKTFFETMCREWERIDRLRIEKYYALVRKFLEAGFAYAAKRDWDAEVVGCIAGVLASTVLDPTGQASPIGLALHVSEVFLPSLGPSDPPRDALSALLEPYLGLLARAADKRMFGRVRDSIFEAIVDGYRENHGPPESDEDDEEDEEGEKKEKGPKEPSAAARVAKSIDPVSLAQALFRLAAARRTREGYRADIHKVRKGLVKAIRNVDPEAAAEADKLVGVEEEEDGGEEPENEEAVRKRKRREAEAEAKARKKAKRAEAREAARAAEEAAKAEASRDLGAERKAERKKERKANREKKKAWVAPWKGGEGPDSGGEGSGGSGGEEEEAAPLAKRPKKKQAEAKAGAKAQAEAPAPAQEQAAGRKKGKGPEAPAPAPATNGAAANGAPVNGAAKRPKGTPAKAPPAASAAEAAAEAPATPAPPPAEQRRSSLGADKRVVFNLKANMQKEYAKGTPFTGSPQVAKRNLAKSPVQGVLKPSPPPKPIVSALGARVEVGRASRA
eukprot:tig00020943_g16333.t1